MPKVHNHEPHTPEQHKAQHVQAANIFKQALAQCAENGICIDVIFQEVIEIIVEGAIVHDRSLSELVANLIDTYEDTRDFIASAGKTEKALKPAGGPQ